MTALLGPGSCQLLSTLWADSTAKERISAMWYVKFSNVSTPAGTGLLLSQQLPGWGRELLQTHHSSGISHTFCQIIASAIPKTAPE